MAIAPIGPVAPIVPSGASAAAGAPKLDFMNALESVNKATTEADALGQQVATGELQDIHQFMAAQTKASLAMELTVAVRNRAVEAYQEIMRMQL